TAIGLTARSTSLSGSKRKSASPASSNKAWARSVLVKGFMRQRSWPAGAVGLPRAGAYAPIGAATLLSHRIWDVQTAGRRGGASGGPGDGGGRDLGHGGVDPDRPGQRDRYT